MGGVEQPTGKNFKSHAIRGTADVSGWRSHAIAVGGDIISVGFLAYEFDDALITVNYGGVFGEINLAGYLGMIDEAEKTAELNALIDAITIYTAAAKASR